MSNKLPGPEQAAAAYARLLEDVRHVPGAAEAAPEAPLPFPGELEVQMLWQVGLLGKQGTTQHHGPVRILDFGEWNRGAGPDFSRVEIELNGARMRGDLEIDTYARNWEDHGHGDNPLYNNVVLHVVLAPPPPGWYTRNSRHGEVPVLHVPREVVLAAMEKSQPPDAELVPMCRAPLADMSADAVRHMLMCAAGHRMCRKRERFYKKAHALGEQQAWFESWAETLGYSANKLAMQALVRRVPLQRLRRTPEALLLGTAGFLVPMLPDQAKDDARNYHREVWDSWWSQRQEFALDEGRSLPWVFSGVRPLNHPHRRVAALAVSAAAWDSVQPLLCTSRAQELSRLLSSLHHTFWDVHCTFNSAPFSRSAALVGRERVRDFLVNHVFVYDRAPSAWSAYLRLAGARPSGRVAAIAKRLFGNREDLAPLLHYHFAHQALLQIDADFCFNHPCGDCLFPVQLAQWR